MQDDKLDGEERVILDAFDADEFESTLTPERRKLLKNIAEIAISSMTDHFDESSLIQTAVPNIK